MERFHYLLLALMVLQTAVFGLVFLSRQNFEFVIYVGVILFFMALVGLSFKKVAYAKGSLAGLALWAFFHLAGGGIMVGNGRLYDVMLIPLSNTYPIFRYDQFVHIFGFFVSTLVMYDLLKGVLKPGSRGIGLAIVVIMAGLGVGALNEILEFLVMLGVPEAGVGGYLNTSLDLCADLIGACLAWWYIRKASLS